MFNKKFIVLAIVVGLIAISAVSAEDNMTDDIASPEITGSLDNGSLMAQDSEPGNFTELEGLIDETPEGNTLILDRDYKDLNSGQVSISKKITIDGQGHTLDANYIDRVFYINATEVTLKNITFINGHREGNGADGGAIYFDSEIRSEIIDCRFINCSGEYGGAIYFGYNSTSTIGGSDFVDCNAQFGGALCFEIGADSIITDSTFQNNIAEVIGGCILAENSTITLRKSNFTRGTAGYESGGAITLISSKFDAENIEVRDCKSEFGGAIILLSSNSTISESIFTGNDADYDGGAIFAMYGSITLDNNYFSDNSAKRGGAVYTSLTNNTITSNQFFTNRAEKGGAIYAMATNNILIDANTYQGNDRDDLYKCLNDNLTMFSDDHYQFVASQGEVTPLPSYYSMLDDNLLTPVKNQGTEGNCWAFSAMAALESCIIKATNGDFRLDLSEANMKNLMAMYSDYGYAKEVNGGGTNTMVYGYLASWLGPIYEANDTYYINDYLSPLLKSILHIQNILILKRESYTDNDGIKEAILRYGAVSTGMYYDSEYLRNNAYYYKGNEDHGNHAVCIVGWDDNYSKSNFKNTPPGDGAWIVRNSWGPSWGNGGYFYVSYYDRVLAKINDADSFTFILNDTVNLNRVYQYEIEPTTFVSIINNHTAYKNIFTVEGNETLSAFSTYFFDECDYVINVYVNDAQVEIKQGKSNLGYYTFYLDNPVALDKGDIVTVEVHCYNTIENGTIAVSFKPKNTNLFLKEGISYYWFNNRWIDLYDSDRVAAIKIFTTLLNTTKRNPNLNLNSEANLTDKSFLIRVGLSPDATGTVLITHGDKYYNLNVSNERSIRLYNITRDNNLLFVKYSGDDKYRESSMYYTVDTSMFENGTYDELVTKIGDLSQGGVLKLIKDYYFDSKSTQIFITKSITIDGQGHTISGAYASTIFNIQTKDVVLKNIRFTEGSGDGALLVLGDNCTVQGCSFVNNSADYGGAVNWQRANGTLRDCLFIDNSADAYGGALFWYGVNGIVENCTFIHNYASQYGGAVYITNESVFINNCSFEDNSALNSGGAICWIGDYGAVNGSSFINNNALNKTGGALFIQGYGCNVSNSQFTSNHANVGGGAVYLINDDAVLSNNSFTGNDANDGGAVFVASQGIEIADCNFTDNIASRYGGAVCLNAENTLLTGSVFKNNTASNGGAIMVLKGGSRIDGCSFIENSVSNYAGAVYCSANTVLSNSSFVANHAPEYAGAIFWNTEYGTMVGLTFEDNYASRAGGAVYSFGAHAELINSTFINTLGINQIYWAEETGTIAGCKFYNTTIGNVYARGDDVFVRRDIGLKYENTTFDYNNPIVKIYSDNLKEVPVLGSVQVEISNSASSKKFSVDFVDGVAEIYDQLIGLSLGTWNVKMAFLEDDNYNKLDAEFSITINPAVSYMNLTAGYVTVGHETNLTANVFYSNGNPINDGKVTFYDGETKLGEVNVDKGRAILAYTPATSGEHAMKAVFAGDNYAASNAQFKLLADAASVSLTVGESTVGYNATFTVNVTALYSSVSDGNISFYIDGIFAGKVPFTGNEVKVTYTTLNAGTIEVRAVYSDSDVFGNAEDVQSLTVAKADSQLIINDVNATKGTPLTLTAEITTSNGLTVNDGEVTFYDGETTLGNANVENGKASLTFTPVLGGERSIRAVFNSNNYLTSNGNAKMMVDAASIALSVGDATVGYNTTFKANVSAIYSTVSDGYISFYVSDKFVARVMLSNGATEITYVPLKAGNTVLKAVYDGDKFSNVENRIEFTVNPAESQIVISNLTGNVSSDLKLTAEVTSPNGLIINGGTVTFTDNGTVIGTADVRNGVASMIYSASKAGIHVIRADFNSDDYESSTDSIEIFIHKSATVMAIDEISNVYYNVPYTFTAAISSNGKPVQDGTVKFYIGGAEIRTVEVTNGQAKLDYAFAGVGEYNITAEYSGSDNYVSSDCFRAFTVTKQPTALSSANVNVVYNSGGYLTATLKDMNGNPLRGMSVFISLGSKTLISDANGQVKLSLGGMAPKTYSVSITFAGTDSYVKSSAGATVVIKKATPKLTAKKKTFKAKVKTKKYAVTLKDNKGKAIKKAKLTIKVKGKTYKATTNSKGKATFKIKKLTKKGKHTATVKYAGNGYFNKVSKNVKITVK